MRGRHDPTASFAVYTATNGTTCEIVVAGELDLATAPELEDLIAAHADDVRIIVVNLADCSFADSTALSVLAKAQVASENGGPSLLLRAPQPAVRQVLAICGLDEILFIDDGASQEQSTNGDRPRTQRGH